MAVDMIRATQTAPADAAAAAVPAPGLNVVPSSAAQGSAIAALERSAEQEARLRADAEDIAAVGGKRKLAGTDDDDSDGPAGKLARDDAEIDI